jgi:DNA mismatch endonuclease, patch repair protein
MCSGPTSYTRYLLVDVVSKKRRSEVMSRIRARNTDPELVVRRAFHRAGFRYRLSRRVEGVAPDLVLTKARVAIFVHGCFWHRHSNCRFAYSPKSNIAFWQTKFLANRERDKRVAAKLSRAGWTVITIWECELKSPLQRAEILGSAIKKVLAARRIQFAIQNRESKIAKSNK